MLDSKAYEVWRRLARRYALEDQPPGMPGAGVSKQVYLTSDADELLRTPQGYEANHDLSGSVGTFLEVILAAAGQRLILRNFVVEATTANVGLALRVDGNGVSLDLQGSAGHVLSGAELKVDEGDAIGVWRSGNAGDASRLVSIVYEIEQAF